MKSLRQLSEEEQREARIATLTEQFSQEMRNIEADYLRNVERSRKFHRRLMLAVTIATALAILLPSLVLTWRLL